MANYAGKMRNADTPAASAADFMPALAAIARQAADVAEQKPTLLADPVAQANLMRKVLFNKDE